MFHDRRQRDRKWRRQFAHGQARPLGEMPHTSARRVGSASAAKVRSSAALLKLTIWFSIAARGVSTGVVAPIERSEIRIVPGIVRPIFSGQSPSKPARRRLRHTKREIFMSDLPITREPRITVRALLLGDRIETAGLERNDCCRPCRWRFAPARKALSLYSAMALRSWSACRRSKRTRSSADWMAALSVR